MLESIIVTGLAAGFIVTLLFYHSDWYQQLQARWSARQWFSGGKPFSCEFCMSFWASFVFRVIYSVWNIADALLSEPVCSTCPSPALAAVPLLLILAFAYFAIGVFASAGLAYVVVRLLSRLDLVIVKE